MFIYTHRPIIHELKNIDNEIKSQENQEVEIEPIDEIVDSFDYQSKSKKKHK